MTGPVYKPTDWDHDYGVGSPIFNQQLAAFNSIRDSFTRQYQPQVDSMSMQQFQPTLQQSPGADTSWRDEDLVAAARSYGIPEEMSRQMPREELIKLVNKERFYAREADKQGQSAASQAFETIASVPAMFAVGAAEAVTGGLGRLPLIGESLRRTSWLHEADMKVREIEEAIRVSNPKWMQDPYSVANIAGNVAAMYYPGVAAWAGAGRAGNIIGLSQTTGKLAIARAAFQGGASTWMLTGGSEDFAEHPYLQLAFGAGIGVAAHGAGQLWSRYLKRRSDALATRVADSFVTEAVEPIVPEHITPTGQPTQGLRQEPPVEGMPTQGSFAGEVSDLVYQSGLPERGLGSYPLDPLEGAVPRAVRPEGTAVPGFRTGSGIEGPSIEKPMEQTPRFGSNPPPNTGGEGPGPSRPTPPTEQHRGSPILDAIDGENRSVQMNKAGAVIQSPEFPRLASQAVVDDVTAAEGLLSTNPGGSSLVQGVANPLRFVQRFGGNVRFVKRNGRLDAMLSTNPITDAMASEYELFGVYTSQRVHLPNGMAGTVEWVKDGFARVMPMYSKVPTHVAVGDLHPWYTSPAGASLDASLYAVGTARPVQGLEDLFTSYVSQKTMAFAEARGGFQRLGTDPKAIRGIQQQNLPVYLEQFLDELGVQNPAERATISQYLNAAYVESYKGLAPDLVTRAEVLQAESVQTPRGVDTPIQRLDAIAATKGMEVVPLPGSAVEVSTVPNIEGETVLTRQFKNEDEAEAWMRNVNRDMVDLTPPTDVPIEAGGGQFPSENPMPSNSNAMEMGAIADAAVELDQFGTMRGEIEAAKAGGNLGRLQNIYQRVLGSYSPMRRYMSRFDEMLAEHGLPSFRPAGDYQELTRLQNLLHTEQHPWMDKAADISNRIRTNNLHNGKWSRVYMIEDDAARLAAAHEQDFTKNEIEAIGMMDQFWADLFPQTGLDASKRIRRYLPELVRKQSSAKPGGMPDEIWQNYVPDEVVEPFFSHMRESYGTGRGTTVPINLRELNPAKLMDAYIRALTWRKVMADPYAQIAAKWKAIGSASPELKSIGDLFENWQHLIKYGYDASDDHVLSAMMQASQKIFGPEFTMEQTKALFTLGMNASHSAMLGFRLHVMARDSLQLLLAIPRAGGEMIGILSRVSKDPEYRANIMQRALDEGIVALHSPRMSGISAFGELQAATSFGDIAAGAAGAEQAAAGATAENLSTRYSLASKAAVLARDLTPMALRDVRDTKFHPMYFYGKQSEFMKAVTWESGRLKAQHAISMFREAGETGSLERLMKDSGMNTYDPAWQREFERMISAGMDAKASSFAGQMLADATQFKYGTVEAPRAARSVGGRIAMQFGQYPLQLVQYARESLVNGDPVDKIRFLAMFTGVGSALAAASKATGWNFNPMNPYYGGVFTGGPLMSLGMSIGQAVQAGVRGAQGNETPFTDLTIGEGMRSAGTLLTRNLNPMAGAMDFYRAMQDAADSPLPGSTVGRYLITGQRGTMPEQERYLQPSIDQMIQNQQQMMQQPPQPMPSPVRGGQWGYPQVPQGQPIFPPGMNDPIGGQPGFAQPFPTGGGFQQSTPASGGGRPPTAQNIPPADVLRQLGVTDPSRVYYKGGQLVYDSQNVGSDGRVPTHFLAEAGRLLQPGQTWEQYENSVVHGTYSGLGTPTSSIDALDPQIQGRAQAMIAVAKASGVDLNVLETRRSQERQNAIFAQGRSGSSDQIGTWTLTSNHYNGRALDFNAPIGSRAYQWLQENAPKFGLVPGIRNPQGREIDPGHVAGTDSSLRATPQYPQSGRPDGGGGAGASF